MPKALGEFGKSRHSDTMHRIVQVLESANKPLTVKELWTYVIQDLDKMQDLVELLRNLQAADRIQTFNGGFLPKKKLLVEHFHDTVDYSLLHKEEIEA